MRISDWSSDVCSSDLSTPSSFRRLTISKKTATHQGQRPLKNSAGAISAIAGSPSHSLRSSNSSNSFVRRCWKYQVVFSSSVPASGKGGGSGRSEEHTSELQSLMRISYAVFCLKKKQNPNTLK